MTYVNKDEILKIFKSLNEEVEYILIRNINNELPGKLIIGKDIDILVNIKNKDNIIRFFSKYNFNIISHPHRKNTYLYGAKKFIFLQNKINNIIFDLNFQLMCRSLNDGEWVPLDKIIQKSAWANKRFEKVSEDFGYWTLGYNDEFIALVVRSIFDKKEFQDSYIKSIEALKDKIDLRDIEEKMKLVFFKFTPFLLKMIEEQEYEKIIKNYLQFKEY